MCIAKVINVYAVLLAIIRNSCIALSDVLLAVKIIYNLNFTHIILILLLLSSQELGWF